MSIAKIILTHTTHNDRVSVTIELIPNKEFRIICNPDAVNDVISAGSENVCRSAVEAACISGVAFGRRQINLEGTSVIIRAANGIVSPDNVTGFAVAAALALAVAQGIEPAMTEDAKRNWAIVHDNSEIQRQQEPRK